MSIKSIIRIGAFAIIGAAAACAEPLAIDVTREAPPPAACPYGPGATANPKGHAITADSRSFFLDGKPWIPVAGEFHYSRYPRAEWREELLKMKAGGINLVSTYVFWIHHEEEQGKFDWSGQRSLRDFLKLCQEVDLKVFVRMGPWCHGEVRNGGFPDWVQNSGTKLRTADPAFLKLVEPLYRETAAQMAGLLWKDGGPVAGIQVDNECRNGGYLLALKALARSVGVDVPFYAMTGWQGGITKEGLIPLFGGYSDGFWGGKVEDYRREYFFTDVRVVNDLGAQLVSRNPANSQLIAQFPYACVEIGAGMMSSYNKRIKVDPANVGSVALSKLGSGNNLPGYYMYQGGTNPDGKLTWLNEEHPNRLPFKDYDFQTALGACGQVREQYHLLRMQHLFLEDFGPALARMPAYFPEKQPAGLKDFDTLRWSVRADGKSGFLFFDNQQPYVPLPAHKDVQFAVKTESGSLLIPRQPVTIPTGSYGIWPVNMDCDGAALAYATAQPLCRIVEDAGGAVVYFFAALDGIEPELCFRRDGGWQISTVAEKEESPDAIRIHHVKTGTTAVASASKTGGGKNVVFVVLAPEQGRRLWRLPFAGRERAILTDAAIFADGSALHLQSDDWKAFALSIFPPVSGVRAGESATSASPDGIFARITPAALPAAPGIDVGVTEVHPAGPNAATLKGMEEATWQDAAVYKLDLTSAAAANGQRVILDVHYIGDAARLCIGDKLFDDHFYNGDAFSIALWRIPVADWPAIRLKILPCSDALTSRLPDEARRAAEQAKAVGSLGKVTASAGIVRELTVSISR